MLFRFILELSDVDRGVYESLDFRVVQHNSESLPYLITRVLAFALSYQDGLKFSLEGLHNPEAPALQVESGHGTIDLWIEIGNASARKLHKATKTAKRVQVYTYKDPEVLIEDLKKNEVHRADEIEIFSFDSKLLQTLEPQLEKNNHWRVLLQHGHLDIEAGGKPISGDVIHSKIKKD